LLTIVVHVKAVADDTPAGDGQGDGASGGAGGAGEDAQEDEAAVATIALEPAAVDLAEVSQESETPHQTEV
jgi:hypothetical protein